MDRSITVRTRPVGTVILARPHKSRTASLSLGPKRILSPKQRYTVQSSSIGMIGTPTDARHSDNQIRS
jgi:hypothetical protein